MEKRKKRERDYNNNTNKTAGGNSEFEQEHANYID